jgi:hypothetical protein
MTVNREAVRDALASLLETALVGDGLPVQAVYNYQAADFGTNNPVVVVSGDGVARPPFTHQGNKADFYLNIHIFVLYSDDASWTEADAEDRLDQIEYTIADTLEANRKYVGYWNNILYEGRSTTGSVMIGGDEYRFELIPVEVKVY